MDSLTDKISNNLISLSYFTPELILIAGLLLLIIVDLLKKKNLLFPLSLVVLGLATWQLLISWPQEALLLFEGFIKLDQASTAWRLILVIGAFISILISARGTLRSIGEFYTLTFGIVLGGHLLVLSSHLLIVYLAIELMSISAYALTLFTFDKRGSEAAVKYLVFGAVSSAIMLYGISWIYTLTGSLFFLEPEFTGALLSAPIVPLSIGLSLVLVGILFKSGAVPFHVWSPDVYTAAPTPVVALFSVVPKLAAVAFLAKWFLVIHLFGLGSIDWVTILSILAILSMLFGNFSALRQQNAKRMMAYSSIAHTGFLMVPIVSLSEQATRGLLFYAFVFLIMNLATFLVIHFFEQKQRIRNIKEYAGIVKKYPLLSILLVVLMVSLVGLPPTAGFTAKLLIFTSLWESYAVSGKPWVLALFIFGLLNTVVALFFYLKIPFYIIFRSMESQPVDNETNSFPYENYFAGLLVLALLVLFFKPDWLLGFINKINFVF
ncbi:MAG: NADH-quinone oxidoreductase subunit N [Bacteroidota bacterium]